MRGPVIHHLSLGRGADRRNPEEHLFVRVPALHAALAAGMGRLAPGSRLRRLLMTRNVSRAYAAANRRDFAVWGLTYDPAVEYRVADSVLPLDIRGVTHGRAEIEDVWREMISSFEDFRAEPAVLYDFGHVLVVEGAYRGHGSGSGFPIHEQLFQVFRLKRGRVYWQQDFSDPDEAFAEAGQR